MAVKYALFQSVHAVRLLDYYEYSSCLVNINIICRRAEPKLRPLIVTTINNPFAALRRGFKWSSDLDFGIKDKTALVLGAGGGLGGAIAAALAAEGGRVAVVDRDKTAADVTVKRITEAAGNATAFMHDLAEVEKTEKLVSSIEAKLGPVDILVNNTGGPPAVPSSIGVELDLWRTHFNSMVASVIHLTDLVVPGMRARKWGRIITSASSGVIVPIENLVVSNALRASLVTWSKTLSTEVAADGVTANIIIPGRIATQRIQALDNTRAKRAGRPVEAVRQESEASIPVGRYGSPDEYAAAAAFLASQQASYITGTVLRIDGGLVKSI